MLEDWPAAGRQSLPPVRSWAFESDALGATYEPWTVRNMLGRALAHRGRFADLEALLTPTLRDAIRRNDLFNVINVRMTAGALLALAHGDTETAQCEIDETESLLSSRGFQLQHVYWLVSGRPPRSLSGRARGDARAFSGATHHVALKRSLLESVQSVRVMTTHLQARAHLALAQRARRAAPGACRCGPTWGAPAAVGEAPRHRSVARDSSGRNGRDPREGFRTGASGSSATLGTGSRRRI